MDHDSDHPHQYAFHPLNLFTLPALWPFLWMLWPFLWFWAPPAQAAPNEIEELRRRIAELEAKVEAGGARS